MTLTIVLDTSHPDQSTLRTVIEFITTGKTIAFPTETFYALGVSAYNQAAVQKVFAIKGRQYGKPLPLLIEGEQMLREVASEIPPQATVLMKEFWPGGLTLIFKARPSIPALVTAHTDTVAVRNSSHPIARLLVAGAACPLTATSANLSGHQSCTSPQEVAHQLAGSVDLIVDGGCTKGLLPSTIIDLTTTPPTIVREGVISAQRIKPFL